MRMLELKIPPVVLTLLCGAAMWFIASRTPAWTRPLPFSGTAALILAGIGAAISLIGALTFRRAGTSTNPFKPQKAALLVTGGIYRFTRNPMYLGLLLGLTAWAVWLGNPLTLCIPPLFVLYMNRFQIGPEENALHRLFGPDYDAFRRKVRRWI